MTPNFSLPPYTQHSQIGIAANAEEPRQDEGQHNPVSMKEGIFPSNCYWEALLKAGSGKRGHALCALRQAKNDPSQDIAFKWLETRPDSIDDFFDKLLVHHLQRKPQKVTQIGLLDALGVKLHNSQLSDCSLEAREACLKHAKADLETLETYELESLTPDQQISYKIFHWQLKHIVEGEQFLLHEYPVNQMFGVLNDLSETLTQFHKIETLKDLETYNKRLLQIPKQFQQLKELMETQWEAGIKLPRFTLERLIHSIEMLINQPVTEHPFYLFVENSLEKISEDHAEDLQWIEHLMKSQVLPAYQNLKSFFASLLQNTHTDHSLGGLPNGKAYYQHCLKRHTSTELTADDIHQLGTREVAKIQQEMRHLLNTLGFTDPNKTVGELMVEFGKDEKHYFPNNQEGRDACINTFEAILERSREQLSEYFDLKPKTPVKIIPTPKHEEEGMPGAYYFDPSLDGSRPGTFYVNLRDMKELPKFGMETLLVHEAEPGHHFQLTLQVLGESPMLRKLGEFNAFVEGWALYTEKLAYEKGFYSTPQDILGHLQDELLRAARLVVDTGIHDKGWSKNDAVDYMQKETGLKYESVVTEVERYFVLPGQACSYKIGQLKILELRKRAMEALGDNFDIRKFHNLVLQVGAAPLAVLEEVIDSYILKHQSAHLRD